MGIENDRTGELYGGAETVDELCRRGGRRLGGGVESFYQSYSLCNSFGCEMEERGLQADEDILEWSG
jgi:hypothetical protein